MKIWVNGEVAEVEDSINVADLAAKYGLQPNTVLIEHNQTALRPREWSERKLGDGDRIEFVRVVAGG